VAWYIAKSLEVLRAQLNARAPHRSTVSDGGIGDASHSARESDHNPTASGQVCARDFTNDPAGGLPGQWLADTLVASRDPRIKYVIFNHRIIDSRAGIHPWTWMPYSGANAHEHHVHVSVFAGALGDDTRPWNLGGTSGEDDDVQLDEPIKQQDGVWNEVGNLLAGTFDAVRGKSLESRRFKGVKDSLAGFVTAIDANVLSLADGLKTLAAEQAKTNAQLAQLVELLKTKDGA
jgi:hypothetical protein